MILCAIVGVALSSAAQAKDHSAATEQFPQPRRQIRLVVPFPAGGQTDFQARLIATRLSAALATTVVVENKPGGSSIIGVEEVARAKADGYTLLYTIASPMVVNPHMFAKLPYEALRDFTPVALTALTAQVLVAHASTPARDVKELIAFATTRPGTLNYGSYGQGSSSHVYAQLLKINAGIDMVHVPYKGAADVIRDLVTGRIDLAFMALSAAQPHIHSGSLKILGVVGGKRLAGVPYVPTMAEQGIAGLELAGWLGIFAPVGTPTLVVEKLNKEIGKVLRAPDIAERFRRGGSEATAISTKEFMALVRADYARWGELIRRHDIRLD